MPADAACRQAQRTAPRRAPVSEPDTWALIRWARERAAELELSPAQAHVLLILASYADHRSGECNPGVRRVAKQARRRERQVQDALAALVGRGLIERRRRGPGATALTRLLAPWVDRRPAADQDLRSAADQDLRSAADQDLRSAAGQDARSAASRRSRPAASRTQDLRPAAGKTCGQPQVSVEQPGEQPEEQPSSTPSGHVNVRAGAREGAEDCPSLAEEVYGILDRGVASLSESPSGRPWPRPSLEVLRRLLGEGADRERALAVAWEVREIVQAQDRAPNVTGLFEQRWRGVGTPVEIARR